MAVTTVGIKGVPDLMGAQAMWKPANEVSRHADLIDAARSDNLAIFLGNGLSRLLGAPAWGDFLRRQEDAFRRHGVDIREKLATGASELEMMQILEDYEPASYQQLLRLLSKWNNDTRKGFLNGSIEPHLPYVALAYSVRPSRIVTVNMDTVFDEFIELHRVAEKWRLDADPPIEHIHGKLPDFSSCIFTDRHYADRVTEVVGKLNECIGRRALLFVGYGHSRADIDIRAFLLRSRSDLQENGVFSLLGSDEYTDPVITHRLQHMGIQPVLFQLPVSPEPETREWALGQALLDLRGGPPPAEVRERLGQLHDYHEKRAKETALIMGHAGVHRILLPATFPPEARCSIPSKEWKEVGGPGGVICRVMSSCQERASLVSRIGTDADGRFVWSKLTGTASKKTLVPFSSDGTKEGAKQQPIEVSHALRVQVPPGAETQPDVFRTWSSCVLLTSRTRVFLDRAISIEADRSLTGLGEKADEVIAEILLDRPSLIYFSKAYADIVRRAFNSDERLFSEETWTVYGADTRRHQEEYLIEASLQGMVNILQAPFDFVWNFFRKRNGQIGYKREEEVAQEIIDGKNPEFLNLVIEEASKWMRKSKPRIIVMTLQDGETSLWINVDSRSFELNEECFNENVRYANSSASVFRGIVMAGLLWVDHSIGRDRLSLVMDSEFMNSLCSVASRAALIKLRQPTVDESLAEIANEFERWKGLKVKHY
ncbi:SIR2 family protein [Streptomyces sp. Rer75]|uniref:SIR2 family protein n=1 Tax=Streptomyces sp. Rer75 TaxID=2750011 RepID=UPI0015CFD878|nr:SIR2 family protein [Streptomyces sp. Rer75]QLH22849.1 SIR2 family protein [Streptomyces sp. Rer75]